MGSGDGQLNILTLDRYVNILQSGTKREKKTAMEDLTSIVDKAEGTIVDEIYGKVQNQLIINFQDNIEVVREHALLITQRLFEKLNVDQSQLILLIPALYPRVCREKDHESSEELRLTISRFLIVILDKQEKNVAPYITEMVDMICRLLKDPSPDIKTTTSQLLVNLVTKLPQETFSSTKKMIGPLLENLTHQRWRVRVATVEAFESLMLKGDNKCVPDVTPALNKKMLDSMYQVRLALVKLAGRWLMKLPDRYSFFAHLLPMILSGLADDNADVVAEAHSLWKEAGEIYLKENEKDLKDRIDYEPEKLDHYPAGVIRPSLGCRALFEKEGTKFLLALVYELTDWVEIVRIKASMLLTQVILHFEHAITISIQKIIFQICKAARDRETPAVVANVKLAAEYMGYFVSPQTYCRLIVEYMTEPHDGEVLVVAALVRGSKRSDLLDQLSKISTLMGNNSYNSHYQLALLDLIESVLKVCQSDSFTIGDAIWAAIVSTAGMGESDDIKLKATNLLEEFVKMGGENKQEIHAKFCTTLLKKLKSAPWSIHCHEQFIFQSLISIAGEVVEGNLDSIIEILRSALQKDTEPEVLLKVMLCINDLLAKHEITLPTDRSMAKFVQIMLAELLPLHLNWSAGRSAEAIRTVACTCLFMCLSKAPLENCTLNNEPKQECMIPSSKTITIVESTSDETIPNKETSPLPDTTYGLDGYLEQLLPLLMSLLQDTASKTRLLTLNIIKMFAKTHKTHQPQNFNTIVSQVIKRLDDADKNVRSTSVEVIKSVYNEHIKRSSRDGINKTLLEFVYSTLLIHLDDKDPTFKQSVLECLEVMSELDPHSLRPKIILDNFVDKCICQNLIDLIEEKMKTVDI